VTISAKETESDFSNNNSLGSKRKDYSKNFCVCIDLAVEESTKLCRNSLLNTQTRTCRI